MNSTVSDNQHSNTAIRVDNLTKIYPLYDKHIDGLKEFIHPLRKKYHHDFYALRDVSFEIKSGSIVGILGKNGAGKSTLLKILSGVTTKTSGKLFIKGKISPLLELGAGLNPALTGIENIYFNGIINGLSRKEMKNKADEIISFADLGEYINQPVFTYSSGMYSRLAFSVAINIDPEILIIDETLSVGDSAFSSKCFNKFEEFKKKGITILFVTHAIDLVIKHCQSAILLDKGTKVADGNVKDIIEIYRRSLVKTECKATHFNFGNALHHEIIKKQLKLNPTPIEYGTGEARIIDFGIINSNAECTNTIYWGEEYIILIKVKFYDDIDDSIYAYTIKSPDGLELTGTNSKNLGHCSDSRKKDEIVQIQFRQKMILNSGKYLLSLGCVKFDMDGLKVMHRIYDCAEIQVTSAFSGTGIAFTESKLTIDSF